MLIPRVASKEPFPHQEVGSWHFTTYFRLRAINNCADIYHYEALGCRDEINGQAQTCLFDCWVYSYGWMWMHRMDSDIAMVPYPATGG